MDGPIAYKSEFGIWIYNNLPPGMRVATREDFFNEDDELILGIHFLAQSFHYSQFEAHISKDNFMEKWDYWLSNKVIFIRDRSY